MPIVNDLEDLKDRGAGRPASADVAGLYHKAFQDFGPRYLWSRKASAWPTFTQALTIGEALRTEGNLAARALAIDIERAVRAAL